MPDPAPCNCGCPNTFDEKAADSDLKRYLDRGPDGTTQSLIDAIVDEGVDGATLLDIGAGVGAIQLALLAAGASSAASVDATEAYVQVARDEAARRGYADRTRGLVGTLEALAHEIEPADVVTLDKVVCCDPDLPALLTRAAERARRMVGLVYPRETWWNRFAARGLAAWGWLTRDPTRWHIHATADIDGILRSAGFQRRDVDRSLIWQVALYVRRRASRPAPPGRPAARPHAARRPTSATAPRRPAGPPRRVARCTHRPADSYANCCIAGHLPPVPRAIHAPGAAPTSGYAAMGMDFGSDEQVRARPVLAKRLHAPPPRAAALRDGHAAPPRSAATRRRRRPRPAG